MKKVIQVGTSDFKELIEGNHYFVDKSLLIKEFLENGGKIILTPRPRRFGKTLNLSMLKYFFDIRTKEVTQDLFKGLKIENEKDIMKFQGEYPVIFISFKGIKYNTFEYSLSAVAMLMSDVYKEHRYLMESDIFKDDEKMDFRKIINKEADFVLLTASIKNLTNYLYKYYNKRVMLFIDEYDVPIQESYIRGYLDEMISLIRNMLSDSLKDNIDLEKAMVTGILYRGNETPTPRVVGVSDSHKRQAFGSLLKESIFSGLNNLDVNTILGYYFNDKFGFTEAEIEALLNYYNTIDSIENIKKWYNGYVFGGEIIYNPWSVLNYLKKQKDGFMPYWINSSSNDLIKKLLLKGDRNMKLELEELIEGKSINKIIDDSIVMSEVEDSNENIWSFLLMSGYLKAVKRENIEGILHCELKIPNKEVVIFYRNLIKKWFQETMTNQKYELMLNMLVNGEINIFSGLFKEFVINNLSYFDVSGNEPERVYHAFVLGTLVSLSENYEVKSNKESGYGRYDVMIIPKDISKTGIIIEFKKIDYFLDDTIEEATIAALKQIEDKKYSQELLQKGVKSIIKLAIVFKGKEINITKGNE
ncbi:AAA family ATPase [Clostridium beijerinckii]|uniref:AAA family ATPase n=1 Tax=Clostridium beijerinckii TaxID=1520 RepID=UPI00080A72FF|nr:AAA family ATPase [Clostridium beijerinckii]OCA96480.1 AAA family ATPase [Clostridium beijerinckii]